MQADDWTEAFEGTRRLPKAVRDRLVEVSQYKYAAAGASIFSPENLPDSLLFLLKGRIRVSQTGESGREIVLYRVEAGQSCVLSTARILAEEAYVAEGIAETDITAISLPRAAFDSLVSELPVFRDFVFAAYSKRLVDLLRVVEEVAFGRIDVRLAARLSALAHGRIELLLTHQQLAAELGTAREVVSRQLAEFQRRGWIEQARGRIKLLDPSALALLAEN